MFRIVMIGVKTLLLPLVEHALKKTMSKYAEESE